MGETESPEVLRDELRTAWHRYVDMLAPVRPALYAYCRRLAGNLWDAEDLVQETLLRAFGHLAFLGQEVRNPRGYLLRTATHVWIDGLRRGDTEARLLRAENLATPSPEARPDVAAEVRDAGARLLGRLAPQERAAVLLKDVFDLGLEEIAGILATTPGAVKAALHRGRSRLDDGAPAGAPRPRRRAPSKELVDRFIDRYHARDVAGLLDLMTEGGSAENVGCGMQYAPDGFEGEKHFLYHVVHGHEEWPEALQPEAVRVARGEVEGEPVLLAFATRGGREALEVVMRFDEEEGRIARIRGYAFCPQTMRAIGETLGVPVRTGLYRYPTPAPGRYFG